MADNHSQVRPYVFLCTGMSLDGKLSNFKGEQSEIALEDDREMLYEGRMKADAVMIGGHTLLKDDSKLTVKTEERRQVRIKNGLKPEPTKVAVISCADDIGLESDFLNVGQTEKIIFTTRRTSEKKIEQLRSKSQVYVFGKDKVDLTEAMRILMEKGINKLMVEGGGELIASLLKEKMVDEIFLKIGNLILGGRNSVTFVDGDGFTGVLPYVKFKSIIQKENCVIINANVMYS